jgi:hypothetical protein
MFFDVRGAYVHTPVQQPCTHKHLHLAHLAVPYGDRQDARLEPKYIQTPPLCYPPHTSAFSTLPHSIVAHRHTSPLLHAQHTDEVIYDKILKAQGTRYYVDCSLTPPSKPHGLTLLFHE